ncbi:MAG: ETX/MTX2 family pore-forming toxin [Spirosomataceae bacterium]
MALQELFSFSDLTAVGSSPQDVKSKFASIYGKQPDGISVNNETYFNAVKPAITQQYGHPCYKTVGEIQYQEGGVTSPTDSVIGTAFAVNDSDQESQIQVSVSGSWSDTTTVSYSTTVGLTFSAEISLEGIFKVGESFSIQSTIGQSSSSTQTKSATTTATVTVPPRSKKQVSLVATLQQETINFEVPITASGMFGANFPDRVNGHYFWFNDVNSLLPSVSGTAKGVIKNASAMHTTINIGEATPI